MTATNSVTGVDNAGLIQNYIAQQQAAASSATSGTSSSTATSISKVTGDFNTFLKILTAQLANQDPLNATDPNEFTRELVQFSGVEQQINTNSKLEELIALSKGNGLTPLIGYVGKSVEAPANNQLLVQNGSSALSYSLPSEAAKVTITVKNSSGATVATMSGMTSAGVNKVAWDGIKSDGAQAEDGVYKLAITATDSNGKALTVSNINMVGVVTGLQTDSSGNVTLSLGTATVKAADVSAVYAGVSSSSSSSSDSSTGTSSGAQET